MADLKKLNKKIAKSQANKKKKKPIPRVDDTPDRIVKAVEDAHIQQNRETLRVLNKLVDKEFSVELDADAIGEAVGRQLEKLPPPQVSIPVRDPVSYVATADRGSRGNILSWRIDPVLE